MKKMRRLIPAIAMLLVSAVMLSTASFAWFTLSTEVTATGMQIQAKADSSLVISKAPMTYVSTDTTVDFETAVTKLIPMTYVDDLSDWGVPNNSIKVNSTSGAMASDDTFKALALTTGENGTAKNYYIEEEIYLASAGTAMNQKKIQITLKAPVSATGSATKAYAAAIYVIGNKTESNATTTWAPGGSVSTATKPDKVVYVDTASNRNVITLDGPYTIPSIVGVGEQDATATTGFKIIIRFYVDGNLESVNDDKIAVADGTYTYAAATGKWDADTTYFLGQTDKVAVPTPDMVDGESNIPSGWYTRTANKPLVNYKYIRSADVPTAASQLEISFTTAD